MSTTPPEETKSAAELLEALEKQADPETRLEADQVTAWRKKHLSEGDPSSGDGSDNSEEAEIKCPAAENISCWGSEEVKSEIRCPEAEDIPCWSSEEVKSETKCPQAETIDCWGSEDVKSET